MGNFLREKLAEQQKQERYQSQKIITHLKNNKIKDVYDAVDYIHDFHPSLFKFNKAQFSDIFTVLASDNTDVLFQLLKNEKGQVELYQALSLFALINGDDYEKRIKFIFLLFDFDHSGDIEMKEFVCSCTEVLLAICKLSKIKSPPLSEIEEYSKIKVYLKINKQQKYNQLDKDRSKTLSINEISTFIKNDFEVQEFLLKYTNIFSYENAVRRFKLIFFEYQSLYQTVFNSDDSIDSKDLKQAIESQKKILQNNDNAEQFIQLLLETSKFISKDIQSGIILDRAFNQVAQAWTAFDACDIDQSNSIDAHELQYLIYCYEGHTVDQKRVIHDLLQIDSAKSGHIGRKDWMYYMCNGTIGMNIFKMDLQEIFQNYDKDNSGELNEKEIEHMLQELWQPIAKEHMDSGKMTQEFFNGIIHGSKVEFIQSMDKDKNNLISWDEFKNFMDIYYIREEKFRNFILSLYDPKKLK